MFTFKIEDEVDYDELYIYVKIDQITITMSPDWPSRLFIGIDNLIEKLEEDINASVCVDACPGNGQFNFGLDDTEFYASAAKYGCGEAGYMNITVPKTDQIAAEFLEFLQKMQELFPELKY